MRRLILAKFKSTCFETGKTISKGQPVLYDPAIKKCYCETSAEYKAFKTADHAEYIQDPGEQYFDNWCQSNGI